jgi:aminoglycoside phosphotransferase (APT) family kinase protein
MQFVPRLLARLEEAGFDLSPAGVAPSDTAGALWTDEQLQLSARLLRRFHDATAGSELAGDEEVVCHNAYAPSNVVWNDGEPVGILRFDEAAPGSRLDDLAYASWSHLNLGLVPLPPQEQARRLRVFVSAYGTALDDDVIDALQAVPQLEPWLAEHREALFG